MSELPGLKRQLALQLQPLDMLLLSLQFWGLVHLLLLPHLAGRQVQEQVCSRRGCAARRGGPARAESARTGHARAKPTAPVVPGVVRDTRRHFVLCLLLVLLMSRLGLLLLLWLRLLRRLQLQQQLGAGGYSTGWS